MNAGLTSSPTAVSGKGGTAASCSADCGSIASPPQQARPSAYATCYNVSRVSRFHSSTQSLSRHLLQCSETAVEKVLLTPVVVRQPVWQLPFGLQESAAGCVRPHIMKVFVYNTLDSAGGAVKWLVNSQFPLTPNAWSFSSGCRPVSYRISSPQFSLLPRTEYTKSRKPWAST
jgi:hypothetical protein